MTGDSGYLYSPFYPKTFGGDLFCLWIIMAKPNKKITLALQDTRFVVHKISVEISSDGLKFYV